MRFSSSTLRMLMKAGSLVFVTSWLLSASVLSAPAAPVAGSGPACFAPARSADAVMLRAIAQRADDGDAAIQDDAPAARLDFDESVAPPLEPMGTLACARDSLPSHRTYSRRSPRGPPIFR